MSAVVDTLDIGSDLLSALAPTEQQDKSTVTMMHSLLLHTSEAVACCLLFCATTSRGAGLSRHELGEALSPFCAAMSAYLFITKMVSCESNVKKEPS
jgi:hypothetical protein